MWTRSKVMWFEYIFSSVIVPHVWIWQRINWNEAVTFWPIVWFSSDCYDSQLIKSIKKPSPEVVSVCVCLWMWPWARDQNFFRAVELRNWRWMDAEKDPFQNDGMSVSPEMLSRSFISNDKKLEWDHADLSGQNQRCVSELLALWLKNNKFFQ